MDNILGKWEGRGAFKPTWLTIFKTGSFETRAHLKINRGDFMTAPRKRETQSQLLELKREVNVPIEIGRAHV